MTVYQDRRSLRPDGPVVSDGRSNQRETSEMNAPVQTNAKAELLQTVGSEPSHRVPSTGAKNVSRGQYLPIGPQA